MTAQIPDTLVMDGVTWSVLCTPLDPFLDAVGAPQFVAPHTANWRGYIASWHVADGRLFLESVEATIAGPDGEPVTVTDADALNGVALPRVADFVTGQLRLGTGGIARYVHADFESRHNREAVLVVEAGRVLALHELAEPSAMGSAGPYQLHRNLLGDLSGGAFGQVIEATSPEGRRVVAKVARRAAGGPSTTEMWTDTPEGRRPVHVPAVPFRQLTGQGLAVAALTDDLLVAVLHAEAKVLERDAGVLLPMSFGVWDHDGTGLPVLVMERLEGRRPQQPSDIVAVLRALADAVDRGTFDAHGDVKAEHVFIEDDGTVRMCDPAPRLADSSRRAFTPIYNPHGYVGPAADVAGCATLLRMLPGPPVGWRWSAAVLDRGTPPSWAHDHRAALAALLDELEHPIPPPPGWQRPQIPERMSFGGALTMPPPPTPPTSFPPADTTKWTVRAEQDDADEHAGPWKSDVGTLREVLLDLRALNQLASIPVVAPNLGRPEVRALVEDITDELAILRHRVGLGAPTTAAPDSAGTTDTDPPPPIETRGAPSFAPGAMSVGVERLHGSNGAIVNTTYWASTDDFASVVARARQASLGTEESATETAVSWRDESTDVPPPRSVVGRLTTVYRHHPDLALPGFEPDHCPPGTATIVAVVHYTR